MIESYDFLRLVIDSVTDHIVVIDKEGNIVFANKAWFDFSRENGLIRTGWEGVNYLGVCDGAAATGDEDGGKAAEGIRSVIEHEKNIFYFEYPCHSPDEKRWFMMRVTSFQLQYIPYYVISHQNITERKLVEEKSVYLSRIDGLGVSNRRYFGEFINTEWRRCTRLNLPVSLAIIDMDSFKSFNDTYGHQAGDECLVKIGEILRKFANRPGDLCARYGGDEFLLVFGDTTIEQSLMICNKLLNEVRELKIPTKNSTAGLPITVSVGLAAMYPNAYCSEHDLIKAADKLLYSAKENGGNQVVYK